MRRIGFPLLALTSFVLSSSLGCGGSSTVTTGDGEDGSTIGDGDPVLDVGGGCVAKTCAELDANCGPMADGCGGIIASCGDCTAPEICGGAGPSKCGTGDAGSCTPKTCAELGDPCGQQGDGCGKLIDCKTCLPPATCGGGGVANQCGTGTITDSGTCVPKTCAAMGYNCGPVADGCGGLVDCGACATGFCGADGKPNVCGAGTVTCKPKTCADLGANCGPVSDGCGALTASCGTCSGTDTCGGGGVPSVCGHPTACVPKTCADFPGTCGQQPDGCGGLTVTCGTCASPQTCGGGGVPSVCGGAPACVPKTCADFPGTCGQQPDGCGALTTSCGTCASPQTCGGGGVPSKCGGIPACVPKTCADFPGSCGPVADGCGGLTPSCGTCTAPAICGGGGVPSQCGSSGGTTCVNLQCKQTTCTGTATTSISGTVFDPAGLHPLPNVNVYVPNGTVLPISSGASCDACTSGLTGYPLVQTTTDVNGKFKLPNMPVDANVPVVIQLGKWRRQITVTTSKCLDTVVPANLSRFPRNKSEGNIPKIALTTGNADSLECLLRKIGIDDAEFTNPDGTGRVNLYNSNLNGGGTRRYSAALGAANFPFAEQLWGSLDPNLAVSPNVYGLKGYDVVMMGCEGTSGNLGNKNNASLNAMQLYVNAGGRVFGEHYHYTWMQQGGKVGASTAAWSSMVTWGGGLSGLADPSQETVLTGFPKGKLMYDWMMSPGIAAATVVPPATAPSRFPVSAPRHSINTISDPNILLWIRTITGSVPQYFSFDTPVGAATGTACGRFVFSDIHVSSGDTPDATNFPAGCTTAKNSMTAQELALEFMFFDLASPVCGGTTPPPTCTPGTCSSQAIECGKAPDGCGGELSCGTCVAPAVCSTGGKCATSSCTAATCPSLGYTCGSWADGCGGVTPSCGTCTPPETCGGGGVPGKCGGTACTPTTCTALGHDCGSWPDGCGGTLTCGSCVAPQTCGGGGVPGKCGGTTCSAATCTSLGYDCGQWADGCGGALTCGTCVAPNVCGGSAPGKCGASSCKPRTCSELGVTCGPSGDGCGGTLDCGTCPPGGGCVPLACGGRCGPQGDGCGGILTCPACPGTCVPTTCALANAECGKFPDGCGGLLTCPDCVAPLTCGGSGVPNKCGGVQ